MSTISLHTTRKIFQYELSDILRNKWVIIYTLCFIVLTDALFRFGGGSAQVMLSLSNVVLILIPLVCILFGTMYLYHAREFIELMLTQPIRRRSLYFGLYLGLALPLAVGYALGVSLPFFWHGVQETAEYRTLAYLVLAGVMLTGVFTALAFYIAVRFTDRVKGLGAAILIWLFFSLLYDGLVLFIAHAFAAYPLEKAMLGLTLFNPVGLARIFLLLNFDISALMGYAGALFKEFFGSGIGVVIAAGVLVGWTVLPLMLGARLFRHRDF